MTKAEWLQLTRYVSTVAALWLLLYRVPTKNDLVIAMQPLQTQITLLSGKVTALDNSLSVHMATRYSQR